MKTKIIEVSGKQYQIGKMTPSAGSFIYFKMMGSMFNGPTSEVSDADVIKAKEAAVKMTADDKARAMVISTFMRGLDYQYVEFAQKQAMMVASRVINAGGAEAIIPVMRDNGQWVPCAPGEVDLQDEPADVQQLTTEVLVFNLAGFFLRRPDEEVMEAEDLGYEPLAFPTLNPLVWRPIAAGLWRQYEVSDGTYDVDDLIDVLEFLDVKAENERRYRRSLENAQHT